MAVIQKTVAHLIDPAPYQRLVEDIEAFALPA
jgi:hypothetical protein